MRRVAGLVPALLGIVAGVVTSLVISRTAPGQRAEAVPAQTSRPALVLPSERRSDDRAKISELERRLADLERDAAPPTPLARTDQGGKTSVEAHEDAVLEHWSERPDAAWALGASASIRKDLSDLAAANQFKVVDVDCKTFTCVGVVEWPSYHEAEPTYAALVEAGYQVNCNTAIHAAQPEDPSVPYRATLLFNCQDGTSGRRLESANPGRER
jgi:hypothetical protein